MAESRLKSKWAPPASSDATVVCVHGAVVRGWEMDLLRRRLRRLGYRVRQFQYRSMTKGLDENAKLLRAFLGATEGDTIHAIGHSMGGVLLRQVFEQDPDRAGSSPWARRWSIAGWDGASSGCTRGSAVS
jgi:pimeloyl-ACP methyl ester carboxylesterase